MTTYATEAFIFQDRTTLRSLGLSEEDKTRLVFIEAVIDKEKRVLCIFSDRKRTVCLDYKSGTVSIAHCRARERRSSNLPRFSHLERSWPGPPNSRRSDQPHEGHELIMDDAIPAMWFLSTTPECLSSSALVYSASWDNDVPKVIRDKEGRIDVAKSVSAACPYLQWFAGAE